MLSFVSLFSGNKVVRIAIPDIMHFIDLLVIIHAALGIIITGAVWLSPLVFHAMHLTAAHGISILGAPIYRMMHIKILWTSIVVLPLLIGMIFISKLKP